MANADIFEANKVLITLDGTVKDLGDAKGHGGHRQYNIGFEQVLAWIDGLELFDVFRALVDRRALFQKKNTTLGTVIATRTVRPFLENGGSQFYPTKPEQTTAVTTFTTVINYSKQFNIKIAPEELVFGELRADGLVLSVLQYTRLELQLYKLIIAWMSAEAVTQLRNFLKAKNKITEVSIKKDKKGDPVIGVETARKWLWGTLFLKFIELRMLWTNYSYGISGLFLLVSPVLYAPLTQALFNFTESTRRSYKNNISDVTTQFANMRIIPYGKLGQKIPKGKPTEVAGAIDADDEYDMTGVNAILFPLYQAKFHVAEIVNRTILTPTNYFWKYKKWYFPRPTKNPPAGTVAGTGINFNPYGEFIHGFNFKFVDPA